MARKIEVQLVADASSFHKALGQATSQSSRFGGILKGGLKVAAAGAGLAILGLGYAAKRGADDLFESQKVAAQLRAVLKSTGGAAGVTAKHVNALAQSLSNMSGVDDEAIGAGENLLLTFRSIQNTAGKGNDIFDQATKATLDLSVAMGEDLHSAALQVGKALNDPVKGLTALKRVGVQFTDSQTNMIKKLVDTGKTARAQKIILGELRKEFGGSAKAAGDTLPGQLSKLRNAFDNVASSLLAKLLPPFTRFITWVTPLILKGMDLIAKGISRLVQPFKDLASKASDSGSKVGSVFHRLVGFFTGSVIPIVMRLKGVFVEGMHAIGKAVESQGPALQRIFNRIGTAIRTLATIIIPILRFALTKVLPVAIKIVIIALDKLTFVIGKVADVVKWIAEHSKGAFNTLKSAVQKVANVIGAIVAPILSALGHVRDAIEWILDHLPDIPSPSDILGGGSSSVPSRGGGGRTGPPVKKPPATDSVVVNLVLDGKVLETVMVKRNKDYRRQNGRGLFA